MSEEENDSPIPELSGLRKEVNPPPELEKKILSELSSRGLIRRTPIFFKRWSFAAVAAILIFASGFATAKMFQRVASPVQYTYVMLLREDSNFAGKQMHEASLVKEYSAWARKIADSGTGIAGEKLSVESRLFKQNGIKTKTPDADGEIAGFFLLKAANDKEAIEKTIDCPHLRHGGSIELRRIEP